MSDTVELVVPEGDPDRSRARRFFDADVAAYVARLDTAHPRSDCRIQLDASRGLLEHRVANAEPPGDAARHD